MAGTSGYIQDAYIVAWTFLLVKSVQVMVRLHIFQIFSFLAKMLSFLCSHSKCHWTMILCMRPYASNSKLYNLQKQMEVLCGRQSHFKKQPKVVKTNLNAFALNPCRGCAFSTLLSAQLPALHHALACKGICIIISHPARPPAPQTLLEFDQNCLKWQFLSTLMLDAV